MQNNELYFSILIAARNESAVIRTLLSSLDKLDFYATRYEILFANDNSEDDTGEILENFARERENVEVFHLSERSNNENLKGKARALAILAKQAKGKYLIFTDADMEVPPSWLRAYYEESKDNEFGVVVGISSMRPNSLKAALQGTEWLNALLSVQFLYEKGHATTGLGNNMMVLNEAYKHIGGYEKLGFSIIEDYQLYAALIKAGYDYKHVYKKELLAYTLPPNNYFEQRSRWIAGALKDSKLSIKIGLLLVSLLIPIYIILAFINPLLSVGLFLINSAFHISSTIIFSNKLKLKGYLKYLPIFIFYSPTIWLIQLCYYVFGPKVKWKNRVFE